MVNSVGYTSAELWDLGAKKAAIMKKGCALVEAAVAGATPQHHVCLVSGG
jgi:hypothetical protein